MKCRPVTDASGAPVLREQDRAAGGYGKAIQPRASDLMLQARQSRIGYQEMAIGGDRGTPGVLSLGIPSYRPGPFLCMARWWHSQ